MSTQLLRAALFVIVSWGSQAFAACNPTDVDWMRCLPDNVPISKISVPGTHDSGATDAWKGTGPLTIAQNYDIARQLNLGVRFLDLRLVYELPPNVNTRTPERNLTPSYKYLRVYHGPEPQPWDADTVLKVLRAFLAAHPSETILLSIKNEGNYPNIFESSVYDLVRHFQYRSDGRGGLWWLNNWLPTLGQARGQIVLIRRFPHGNNPSTLIGGLDATAWPNNGTRAFAHLSVEDLYDNPGQEEKKLAVKKHMQAAQAGLSVNALYITFGSATGGKAAPWHTIDYYAGSVNNDIKNFWSSTLDKRSVGVVAMDKIDIYLSRIIWVNNPLLWR